MKNYAHQRNFAFSCLFISIIFLFLFCPFVTNGQLLKFDGFDISSKGGGNYGGISTNFKIFDKDLLLSSPIVTSKEDIEFKGEFENELTFKDFISGVGGNDLFNQINVAPFQSLLSEVKLPGFDFSIFPVAKKFSMRNDIGTQFDFQKKGADVLFAFEYSPGDFKFSSINSSMSVMDDINYIDDLIIRLTNDSGGKKQALELQVAGAINKDKLVNDFKQKDPNNVLQLHALIEALPELSLEGAVATDYSASLAANADFNLEITDDLTFEGVGLNLSYEPPKRLEMGINGSGLLKIDNTNLHFGMELFTEPASASIGGGFNLSSLDRNGNLQEWYEPFGIPKISFIEIGGALSVSGTTVLDKLAANIDMKLGDKASDKRISGKIDIELDVNDPLSSVYESELENFKILSLIEAFESDVEIPDVVKSILNIGINKSTIRIDPKNASALIEGDVTFFDVVNGRMKIDMDPGQGRVGFAGSLDPIKFAPGGIEIFSVNKKGKPNEGAGFDIELSGSPRIDISGEMRLFGIVGSETEMYIDKNGIFVSAQTDFAGLMKGKIDVRGQDFINTGKLKVDASFEPGINKIFDEIENFVRENGGAIAGEIVGGLLNTFSLNKISIHSEFDKWTTQFNLKVDFTAFGVDLEFDLPVDIDFARPDKIPETVAKLIAALGEQVILNAGSIVGALFEKGLELAEEAVVAIGEGVVAVAKEVEKGLAEVGKGFEAVFNGFAKLFEDRKFEAPRSSGANQYIKAGFRHYSISFNNIEILELDDKPVGIGPIKIESGNGDDVYGQVYFMTKEDYEKANSSMSHGPLDVILSDFLNALKPQVNFSSNINRNDMYLPPGNNRFFYGVGEAGGRSKNYKKGAKIGSRNTKHFYVKHNSNYEILLGATLFEEDDSSRGSDDFMPGRPKLIKFHRNNLGNLEESIYIDYSNGAGKYRVHFTFRAYEMITPEKLLQQIRSSDFKSLVDYIGKGGEMSEIENMAMDTAVHVKNKEIISYLADKYKLKTYSRHLDFINDSTYVYNRDFVYLIFKNLKDYENINFNHIQYILSQEDYWFVNEMIEKGAKPNNQNLRTVLDKKIYPLAKKMIDKGANVTRLDWEKALKEKDIQAVDLFLPNWNLTQGDFLLAAQANDIEIFKRLYAKDQELINTIAPAQAAINNKNMAILKMSMNKKVTPEMIIVYATSKNYKPAVFYCLEKGANPQDALLKALEGRGKKGPDMEMLNALIYCKVCKNKIDPKKQEYLISAIRFSRKGSHYEAVKLFLENGADPNLYVDAKNGNTLLHIVSMKRRKRAAASTSIGQKKSRSAFSNLFVRTKRDHGLMKITD